MLRLLNLKKEGEHVERIYAFLPSILILAVIAGATSLYLKWITKRFGDNLKSVEWLTNNQWKAFWAIGMPGANVGGPAVEELIFRAPLIIAFSAMSSVAWYGVFASSTVFALLHWPGKKILMPDILSTKENGDHKSDDIEAEIHRLHTENGEMILRRKMFHVIFAFPVGILTGYYGIKYQSVWVAFGIHSAWNFVMPIVLPILVYLGAFVFLVIASLWDRARRKRRMSW